MYIRITLILFITILIGCRNLPDGFIKTSFYTQDSIYKITFDKPLEFDSFYEWVHYSDNACDDTYKYRFSKKGFPIEKETGFLYFKPKSDTIYRLTFSHIDKYRCKSNWKISADLWFKRTFDNAIERRHVIDTLKSKPIKVNGLDFAIIAYKENEKYESGYLTNIVKGITYLDSSRIVFTAECRTKNCEGFIERMIKVFQTIRIEKNK